MSSVNHGGPSGTQMTFRHRYLQRLPGPRRPESASDRPPAFRKRIPFMSSFPDSPASSVRSKATPWSANPITPADWRGSGGDRLSGENIDAQIRRFFENTVDRELLRP